MTLAAYEVMQGYLFVRTRNGLVDVQHLAYNRSKRRILCWFAYRTMLVRQSDVRMVCPSML